MERLKPGILVPSSPQTVVIDPQKELANCLLKSGEKGSYLRLFSEVSLKKPTIWFLLLVFSKVFVSFSQPFLPKPPTLLPGGAFFPRGDEFRVHGLERLRGSPPLQPIGRQRERLTPGLTFKLFFGWFSHEKRRRNQKVYVLFFTREMN